MPLVHAYETVVKGTFDVLNFGGNSIAGQFTRTVAADDKDEKLVTYTSNGVVNMQFAEADDKTGRKAGYHIAIRATLPAEITGAENIKKVKYSTDKTTWKNMSGKDNVLNAWYRITKEEYASGNNLERHLYLDWDGNGSVDQEVKLVIRTGDLDFKDVDENNNKIYTVTVKNNVDNGEVKLTVVNNKSLDDLAESVLNSVKTKAGYEFVRFYQTKNEKAEEYATSEKITADVVIVAEFKKSGSTTTTPSGNQGSSTTKPADKDKDSTPKTGNTDLMGFVPLMTLLSLVGIVTLKKTI